MRLSGGNLFFNKAVLAFVLLALSCGEKKEEKKAGFEMRRSKTEKKTTNLSSGITIDLDNDGVGPYKNVIFSENIDTDLATAGEKKYNAICTSCHMAEKRLIGPPLKDIYKRRSPAWVLNMIANPNGMLKKDPIARALLKEYNNAIMLNQNLSKKETRAVAEYLRTL